jgi:serine phosphatase RsbU (regulator of sigma subunit)
VLYTDGLIECTRDIDRGLDELRQAAAGRAGEPLDDMCDDLLGVLAPTGGYRDDVAILALRRE